MKSVLPLCVLLTLCLTLTSPITAAQESAVISTSHVVPSLINYNGVLKDSTGRTLTSLTGVTFLLYKDEQGGAPLWMETQNIMPDKAGRYTVQLGAASKHGIPPDLFMNGEARWLAAQIGAEPEQARVLLVAVPYAMKSIDAQTLGGLPPSAFMLAAPPTGPSASATISASSSNSTATPPPPAVGVTTSGAAANLGTLPLFNSTTDIEKSIVTQTGTTAINVHGSVAAQALLSAVPNASATGTLLNKVAKLTGSPSAAVVTSVTDTGGALGIVVAGAGTTGSAQIALAGQANCIFDGATTAGHYIQISAKTAGDCHDAGNAFPGIGQVLGRVLSTNAGAGTYAVSVFGPEQRVFGANGDDDTAFSANNTTQVLSLTQNGGGIALLASTAGNNTSAVYGKATSTTGFTAGVSGDNNSTGGVGVYGFASAATGGTVGTYGEAKSTRGTGVWGNASANFGFTIGVKGTASSSAGTGVFGGAGSPTPAPQTGSFGVQGISALPNGAGVLGYSPDKTAPTSFPPDAGVVGLVDNPFGFGVFGIASSTTTPATPAIGPAGVAGQSVSVKGTGVYGINKAGAANPFIVPNGPGVGDYGVQGISVGPNGVAVFGHVVDLSAKTSIGVQGTADSGVGVVGSGIKSIVAAPDPTVLASPNAINLQGGVVSFANIAAIPDITRSPISDDYSSAAVYGRGVFGVEGVASTAGGAITAAKFINNNSSGDILELYTTNKSLGQVLTVDVNGDTILGNIANQGGNLQVKGEISGPGGGAVSLTGAGITGNLSVGGNATIGTLSGGNFLGVNGDLNVTGAITAGTKDFKIDHPLAPTEKYLYHASVESSEMMDMYTGTVLVDGSGEATVQLPEWFEALNKDYRYQLTAIGAPSPNLYIAQEVHGNRFQIAGGKPGGKVSWQVTAIRHDAYAQKHRIQVEEEKPAEEQGFYLSPDSFGQPKEKGVAWARAHAGRPTDGAATGKEISAGTR